LNTVEGRLAALRGDGKQVKPGKYSTWLKGFAGYIKQTAKEMYDGYRSSTTGSAIGADTRITNSLVGGLSLAYSDSEIKQDDFRDGDKTNAKAWQGSVYSSLDVTDRLYLEGAFAYAHDQYKGQRRTAIDRTADSDFDGSQLTGRVAAGYRINLDSMQTLTPMVSMQWSRLNLDGYTETGADALNLKVDSQKLTSNRLGLGMRYGLETRSKGLTFRPEVSATWFNDSGDRNKAVVASYAGGGSSFATPVAGLEKHSYTIGAGLSVLTDNNSGVALNYDYTAASGAWAHDVQLVGRIAF
ncbi:MAG: autotransporter outer membrane beta-barrel domain-containing protein, partial [Chlorobaculum sp.]|nr:autotransporter outer membrane beta-barrel domain-containing protein [Chlorobaculum sp.]